jgi:tetratricopeptide (TPR) repeat protein
LAGKHRKDKETMRILPPLLIVAVSLSAVAGCGPGAKVRALNREAYEFLYYKKPTEAIPLCQEAVRLAPNDAESHKNLGLAYAETAQFTLAEQELRTALRLRPNYDKAYNNLGKTFQGMGRYDEAFAAYKEAIRITPGYAIAHQNLASALFQSGKTADAIAMYEKAIRLDPDVALPYIELGEILLHKQKRFKDALTVLKAGTTKKPENAELHRLLAAVYRDTGDLASAVAEWEKTVSLDPESYMAYRSLADAYRRMNRPNEATGAETRLRELAPIMARDFYNEGTFALNKGRYADAIPKLQEAARLQPENEEAHYNLGVAFEESGRYADALQAFRQARTADPKFTDAYFKVAEMLYKTGDKAGGRAVWESLARTNNPQINELAQKRLAEHP